MWYTIHYSIDPIPIQPFTFLPSYLHEVGRINEIREVKPSLISSLKSALVSNEISESIAPSV